MSAARALLSVTMITFNEERRVRAALDSVAWADEIVVVDSFSTDATVQICREYTEQVELCPWQGYVEQKNVATARATHEWVLNLDADEVVSSELALEIQNALTNPGATVGFYMPRKTYYLGAWINHCGWYPDHKLRLFRKSAGRWVGQALHEKVEVHGPTAYFRHPLYHYSYEDLADHLHRIDAYTTIAAAHKTRRVTGATILTRTMFTFLKKYFLKQGFRDGTRGLIVSLLSAFTVTVKYAKAWERQNQSKVERSDDADPA
jgi:glycosyltransferase involved in cell wall biosynthesis